MVCTTNCVADRSLLDVRNWDNHDRILRVREGSWLLGGGALVKRHAHSFFLNEFGQISFVVFERQLHLWQVRVSVIDSLDGGASPGLVIE